MIVFTAQKRNRSSQYYSEKYNNSGYLGCAPNQK